MINQSLGMLERFTGTRPVGWLGPGLTETEDTPDLLAAAGVKYIGDWVYDDEPTEIRTAHGPLVTLPYTVELNDIPMMLVQHHESAYFTQRCIDTFERLWFSSTTQYVATKLSRPDSSMSPSDLRRSSIRVRIGFVVALPNAAASWS